MPPLGFDVDGHAGRILSPSMRIVVDVSPLSRPLHRDRELHPRAWWPGSRRRPARSTSSSPSGRPGRAAGSGSAEALAGLPVELRLPLMPHGVRKAWSRWQQYPVERVVGPLDVFHFSDWMYPPQRDGLRATTVHDLIPLHHPEWVEPETVRMHGPKYEHAARTCDRIFVNSRFTGGEVVELLGVPEERIRVAYPGIDPRFRPEGEAADLGGPYVLAVSTLEPRKNLPALVAAFSRAAAAASGADAGDRRASRAGSASLSPPRACACSASSRTTCSRGSTAARRRSRTRPGSRASACRSSRRWRAACRRWSRRTRRSTRPRATSALRADPDDAAAFADALERSAGAPRGTGVEHAARFTWRACGEAVLAGYLD